MSEEVLFALSPGGMLNEYKIERVLGSGGFGITYLAEDVNLHKEVAIKEYFPTEIATRDGKDSIRPKSEKHEEMFVAGVERFINEAKAVAQFNHPNIVKILRFFAARGTAYFVMDFYQGATLDEYLERNNKRMSGRMLEKIFLPIMRGLQVVHKAGLIHRDIKPGNIYLRKDGEPLLLDFGAARYAMGKASKNLSMVLTPGFAPFEQYRTAGKSQGPWTDIYSLSATMYRCITGETPAEAPDRAHAVLEGSDDPYQAASHPSLSASLLATVDRGLAFRFKDRPATIEAFAESLGYSLTNTAGPAVKSKEESAWEEYGKFFEFAIASSGEVSAGQRKALNNKAKTLGINSEDVAKIEKHLAHKNGLNVCPDCGNLYRGDDASCDNCTKQPTKIEKPATPVLPSDEQPKVEKPATSPDEHPIDTIAEAVFDNSKYTGTGKAVWWLVGMFGLSIMLAIIFDENNLKPFGFGDVEDGIFFTCLLALFSGTFLMISRKKQSNLTEKAVFWWGIAFSLTWIFLITEIPSAIFGNFLGEYTSRATNTFFGVCAAFLGVIYLNNKYKDNEETAIAVYWLGLVSVFYIFSNFLFREMDYRWYGTYSSHESALTFASLMALISGFVLIYLRKEKLKRSTMASLLYWLGFSLTLSLFLASICDGFEWNIFDYSSGSGSQARTGFLFSLLIVFSSAVYIWKQQEQPLKRSEILLYLFGIGFPLSFVIGLG